MPTLRYVMMAAILCCTTLTALCQETGWKPVTLDDATFRYPASWQVIRVSHGYQTLLQLTPDSMKELSLKMVEIFDAPLTDKYNFGYLRTHFSAVVLSTLGEGGKLGAAKDITFHNHACLYAEAVMHGLPVKVYALDGLFYVYLLLLTQRRYSQIADPALERDEMAILNSITYRH